MLLQGRFLKGAGGKMEGKAFRAAKLRGPPTAKAGREGKLRACEETAALPAEPSPLPELPKNEIESRSPKRIEPD